MKRPAFALKTLDYLAIAVVVLAAFLRLYNFSHTLMFQGDQGRDAIIVARIFREADPVFIGPVTSVGNMYLGPFYYYFMLPFLLLSYPSPLGPAYAVAVISILTTALVYVFGKKLYGAGAALIATFMFAFNAVAVEYARFSWNPNIAPFFSLLAFYFTFLAWKKKHWFWVPATICFAILIQLHYVTLLVAGGMGIVWLTRLIIDWRLHASFWQLWQKERTFFLATLLSLLVFLASLSPLVLFDIKHDFLNAKAFAALFTKEDALDQNGGFKTVLKETQGRGMHIFYEIHIGKDRAINSFLYVTSVSLFIYLWLRARGAGDEQEAEALFVLAAFLFAGVLGTAFYKHTVFDHYILYLFPLSVLFHGIILRKLWQYKLGMLFVAGFLGYFVYFNWQRKSRDC